MRGHMDLTVQADMVGIGLRPWVLETGHALSKSLLQIS